MALHSITHTVSTDYWRNISVDDLSKEFAGERDLVSKFANVSADDLNDIRLPFLQMSGDNSFEMLNKNRFLYDCWWRSQHFVSPGMWLYTLDARSAQDYVTGAVPQQQLERHLGRADVDVAGWTWLGLPMFDGRYVFGFVYCK